MSEMKLYNSLTRKKESFKPKNPPEVLMYVCGPTVQGPMHLGHARTYISFDLLHRYLRFKNFDVKFVMNITDIHDDIIKKAQEQGKNIKDISEKYIKIFFNDLKALKIKKADVYPRVTQTIPKIIDMIKILQNKGFAYETNDGVYYQVSKFKDYGKLSGMKPKKKRQTGKRIQTDKYDKNEMGDFALWKKEKPGEPSWQSPWGKGRPGWHIECSVMSKKHLGEQIDLHGGGMDLKFPHHENEIAQSEAASGKKPFVRFWVHTGFLNVDGQKMSKSLGNFITIPELLKRFSPEEIRFFMLSNSYSSRLDFTDELIKNSKEQLRKINKTIQMLLDVEKGGENKEIGSKIDEKREEFFSALDDDLNTPQALAILFELIRELNKANNRGKLREKNSKQALNFLRDVDSLFDAFSFEKEQLKVSKEIEKLVEKREKCRKNKNWSEADKIRDEILEKGYILEDGKNGPKVKKRGQI